jgi:hypothetical protein
VAPVATAPLILTTGTSARGPDLLSSGSGVGSATQPDGVAEGPAPVVQSEAPHERLFSEGWEPVHEPIPVPALDAYLTAWGRSAATEGALRANWFGENLALGPEAAPAPATWVDEGADEPARGEWRAVAVAALLVSVAPRWNEARQERARRLRLLAGRG